ncbi:MAG: ATP-grasp domain-containing protein [Hahellaceae bacterium]|nr:ATP-grasp domain-containing protein [Hahellaceae bacterium]
MKSSVVNLSSLSSRLAGKDWTTLRVALTGLNNRPDNPGPGYAVAKCLQQHSAFQGTLVGLSYDSLDGGLYDQTLFSATYLLPYPSAGEEALFTRLREIHQQHPFDVLIPNLDAELLAFSRLQPRLAALGITLLLPSTEMILKRDKDKLPELCRGSTVATPDIRHLSHARFFIDCELQGWHYPMVVKGRFYDAEVVHNATQANAAFHRLAAQWGLPVIVQRHVQGQEFNVAAVGDGSGGVLGLVMMRKRALTDKGKAWAGTSIANPVLEQQARALIAALRWSGPLEVEMMCDTEGTFHLLEINPRFPAWVYLSHGTGCNLPVKLLQHLCSVKPASTDAIPAPEAAYGRPGVTFIRYAEERFVTLEELEHMALFGALAGTPTESSHESSRVSGNAVEALGNASHALASGIY